jgi:hypothetical protein
VAATANRKTGTASERRQQAIIEAARKLYVDLQSVGQGDKARIRETVLKDQNACATRRTFDAKWQAMREAGLIRDSR